MWSPRCRDNVRHTKAQLKHRRTTRRCLEQSVGVLGQLRKDYAQRTSYRSAIKTAESRRGGTIGRATLVQGSLTYFKQNKKTLQPPYNIFRHKIGFTNTPKHDYNHSAASLHRETPSWCLPKTSNTAFSTGSSTTSQKERWASANEVKDTTVWKQITRASDTT